MGWGESDHQSKAQFSFFPAETLGKLLKPTEQSGSSSVKVPSISGKDNRVRTMSLLSAAFYLLTFKTRQLRRILQMLTLVRHQKSNVSLSLDDGERLLLSVSSVSSFSFPRTFCDIHGHEDFAHAFPSETHTRTHTYTLLIL
jgi:hypothetical protein